MPERKTLSGDSSDDASPDPAYLARRIDASAMKAFAHPLRMAMYDYLNDHDSATATTLARHLGESTGQTSYHLRQLERHGFVEEDRERGTARERWWKAVGFRIDGPELAQDSATRPAVEAMLRNQVTQRGEALREWFLRSVDEPEKWQTNSMHSRATATMTAQETAELSRALLEVIHEHTEQAKASREASATSGTEDDETRRLRIYVDVFPLPAE